MGIILFGAGKIGNKFIESQCFKRLKSETDNIVFYDNNKALPTVINGVKRLDKLETMSQNENVEIIITCAAWTEVYRLCIQNGYKIIKIYDEKSDEILTIRDYCKRNVRYYENWECAKYHSEKNKEVLTNKERFLKTGDLFGNMTEVAIMLSNLCNYAEIHQKCPASCILEKQIMPSRIVYKILDELAMSKYHGTICFHIYNEPLIDPRLFMFIQYIKKTMPSAKVKIYSNGYYLNTTMFEELHEIGTNVLFTTGYGKHEYERLIELDTEMGMALSVCYGNLDDRMDYYTKKSTTHIVSNDICDTYLYQIPIYSNGDIGTCCLDYRHPYGLGNINECSLENCLRDRRIIDFQMKLLRGDRTTFPICTNCCWRRGYS